MIHYLALHSLDDKVLTYKPVWRISSNPITWMIFRWQSTYKLVWRNLFQPITLLSTFIIWISNMAY